MKNLTNNKKVRNLVLLSLFCAFSTQQIKAEYSTQAKVVVLTAAAGVTTVSAAIAAFIYSKFSAQPPKEIIEAGKKNTSPQQYAVNNKPLLGSQNPNFDLIPQTQNARTEESFPANDQTKKNLKKDTEGLKFLANSPKSEYEFQQEQEGLKKQHAEELRLKDRNLAALQQQEKLLKQQIEEERHKSVMLLITEQDKKTDELSTLQGKLEEQAQKHEDELFFQKRTLQQELQKKEQQHRTELQSQKEEVVRNEQSTQIKLKELKSEQNEQLGMLEEDLLAQHAKETEALRLQHREESQKQEQQHKEEDIRHAENLKKSEELRAESEKDTQMATLLLSAVVQQSKELQQQSTEQLGMLGEDTAAQNLRSKDALEDLMSQREQDLQQHLQNVADLSQIAQKDLITVKREQQKLLEQRLQYYQKEMDELISSSPDKPLSVFKARVISGQLALDLLKISLAKLED
ncbi:TPA: hypothetical protein DEO28_02030 [Candidatus Dependentiae bacterium]|nr:MAG: hypothetical protein UR14_C0004G0088 [candidate division TM6 bacterium GW2011_GWE2_31_21]KKP53008.1 MAG: hypothetical protein UR43_C0008G0090 [candidate division TM6 bacterium GW2011_GWF2_33_332]HBS47755.1 hypothetical protein [Candidatus Dependentiae bacterium]HBZ73269.1 hypothetical protein [Candidatus Dependentiae bacterium]